MRIHFISRTNLVIDEPDGKNRRRDLAFLEPDEAVDFVSLVDSSSIGTSELFAGDIPLFASFSIDS